MKTKASAELLLSSQTSCRVLVIGIGKNHWLSLIENQLPNQINFSVLSCLHTGGILISSYLMTERILEPDLPEKPFLHICTEAIICPFYRILGGISAIVVQLVGSGKLFSEFILK